jgi:hypothetical protein
VPELAGHVPGGRSFGSGAALVRAKSADAEMMETKLEECILKVKLEISNVGKKIGI